MHGRVEVGVDGRFDLVAGYRHAVASKERWQRRPTFVLPWLVYVATDALLHPQYQRVGNDRAQFLVAILVGVATGALWQLLGRRDLADRLVWPSVLIVGGGIVTLVSTSDGYSVTMALFCFGLVGGLVACEQALRVRDRGSIWRDPTRFSG